MKNDSERLIAIIGDLRHTAVGAKTRKLHDVDELMNQAADVLSDAGQRIQELESAIRRLLDVDFSVPPELDGDAACFYCSAYLQGGEPHENDCPYMEAKRLIGD